MYFILQFEAFHCHSNFIDGYVLTLVNINFSNSRL